MQELEDIHKRYRRMGRISWSRFELGQRDLATLREKLTVQMSAVNAFIGSLTIGALGRMEPMLERVYQLLDDKAKQSLTVAETILSAKSDDPANWERLTMELRTEGIPEEYIRDNQGRIKEVIASVIEMNDLEGYNSEASSVIEDDGIHADESASQVLRIENPTESPQTPPTTQVSSRSRSALRTSQWLASFTPEEQATEILLQNHGYDLRKIRVKPGKSTPPWSTAQAVWNWAVDNNNKFAAKLILERFGGQHILVSQAARHHKWDFVHLCLDAGGLPEENMLCQLAVMQNRLDILTRLLDMGISVRKQPPRSITADLLKGFSFPKILKVEDSFYYGWTPLHFAAFFGAYDTAKLLLEKGVYIHALTEMGSTPLHLAAIGHTKDIKSAKMIQLLIDRHANVSALDSFDQTPLRYVMSIVHRRQQSTKLLVNNSTCFEGYNPGSTKKPTRKGPSDRWSYLHEALKAGEEEQLELIQRMLERGADINFGLMGYYDLGDQWEWVRRGVNSCMRKFEKSGTGISSLPRFIYPSLCTPIMKACDQKAWRTAIYLKAKGANLRSLTAGHLSQIEAVENRLKGVETEDQQKDSEAQKEMKQIEAGPGPEQ